MDFIKSLIFLAGRVCYGMIFFVSGLGHFVQHEGMSSYATRMGVPHASLLVYITGALIILGSLSLVLGIKPAFGAVCVLVFLGATNYWMHPFWRLDEVPALEQQAHFMKNLALMGAALMFINFKSWPLSIRP